MYFMSDGPLNFLARAVAIRRSTGNDVSGHYFHNFFRFSVLPFSHRSCAPIKEPNWRKLLRAPNNLRVNPFSDPVGHLGRPGALAAISDFAGSAVLQAVSKGPWRH